MSAKHVTFPNQRLAALSAMGREGFLADRILVDLPLADVLYESKAICCTAALSRRWERWFKAMLGLAQRSRCFAVTG